MRRNHLIRTRGYTLIEILVVMAIFSLLLVSVFAFFINSQKTMFNTTMKLKTSAEMRHLTAMLDNDGRNADAIVLHDDFDGAFRDATTDDAIIGTRLVTGNSGKMIILLYYNDDPDPSDGVIAPIEKIVCYFVDPGSNVDDEYAPIYRMQVNATSANEYSLPEAILPSEFTAGTPATELARGLSGEKIFYKFAPNSVVFNSSIKNGNVYANINNIHNFTITSR